MAAHGGGGGRRRAGPLAQLLLLLLAPGTAHAHPYLYRGANCTSHPTASFGRHLPPRPDPAGTAFEIRSPAGRVVTGVCPGVRYSLSVAFYSPATGAAEARKLLLTASLGSLANGTSECPGKEATGAMAAVASTAWTLPCSLPPPGAAAAGRAVPVELRATSATGASGAYLQASATVPLRLNCVTNGCRAVAGGRG
jgi:hypothetical protein